MRVSLGLVATAFLAAVDVDAASSGIGATWEHGRPLVTSWALQRKIKSSALLSGAKALEAMAYATPGRNRLTGTKGHNDTVTWIYNELTSLGDYYDVSLQPWIGRIQTSGVASFLANGDNQTAIVAQYSPSTSGTIAAPVVSVANLGCNSTDFPSTVSGNIALISRGNCTFITKSALAAKAGAVGAVVYNNVPGPFTSMTLGGDDSPIGNAVPTVGITQERGVALLNLLKAGTAVIGQLSVKTVIEDVTTYNVLAETRGCDDENVVVLGAHSDSVPNGPGINDDGSGIVGILEVAKQLSAFRTLNSVRFAFWSGEEEGLLGSTFYVAHLSKAERSRIKIYLNFDMIASPNYIYGIFDGDGSSFNFTGPQGSGNIERLFQHYYVANGHNHTAVPFTGRSDYDAFVKAGIPSGGIQTGSDGIKTKKEVELFGGVEGVAYDINYHGPGDNVTNLHMTAFLVNTRAIAHAVGVFGRSLDGLSLDETVTEENETEDTDQDDEDGDEDEKTKRIRRYPQPRVSKRSLRLQTTPGTPGI